MTLNQRLRIQVIAATWILAIGSLVFLKVFGTMWSNHCDPGNAQFHLLKDDPVVSAHISGGLMLWEADGPDNGWLCSGPHLSLSYVGFNHDALKENATSALVSAGWTEATVMRAIDPGGWRFFDKTTSDGVKLTAFLIPAWYGVAIDMDAPGLHMGDQGFQ